MSDYTKVFWCSLLLSFVCIAVMGCLMFYGLLESIEMVVQLVMSIVGILP